MSTNFDFNAHIHKLNKPLKELEPFPFLTDKAIEIVSQIIKENEEMTKSSDRITSFIRGLGYKSSFLKDLSGSEKLLNYLKDSFGEIVPHYMLSNVAHINIGNPSDSDVDKWHYDSVPYVLIILLSDPSSFEGGELEYEKDGKIERVHFKHSGYAVFMEGSRIKHHVCKVTKGQRLTLINSYMKNDFRSKDSTIIETFRNDSNFMLEVLKGKSWWFGNKLLKLSESEDSELIYKELKSVVEDLQDVIRFCNLDLLCDHQIE